MSSPSHEPSHQSLPGNEGSLSRSIWLTVLSTILPGAGLLGARSRTGRVVGVAFPLVFLATLATMGWLAYSDFGSFAGFSVSPTKLRRLMVLLPLIGLIWVALIAATHIATRPRGLSHHRRATGAVMVTILSLVISAPFAVASRYALDQQMLLNKIFQEHDLVKSTSRPDIDSEKPDPWKDHPRLNILILGGDSSDGRDDEWGVRMDTIMVASINTSTGATTIVQIPRNVQYTPFPEGSEMHELFPEGFRGEGSADQWYVNTIWETVERNDYPDVFEDQTFRGAEALKQGAEGITGLRIDYFVMLNIDGIQRLIDSMGGVRVNINERLPRGGDSWGRQPNGYLEPGPNQQLDGYDAMWYARSRSSTDDYSRMARQSCLIDAIIDQASPKTMLTSYEAIAAASADMVMTDIPQNVLEPLVELAWEVKGADVERLVFSPGKNGYDYAYPDFDTMREAVDDALISTPAGPPAMPESPSSTESEPTPTEPEIDEDEDDEEEPPTLIDGPQNVTDACAYNPA